MPGTREQFVAVEHRSLQPDRLANPAERIFLEEWQRIQNRGESPDLLEMILQPMRRYQPGLFDNSTDAYTVSQRDAEVAASIIQWLGTCVGKSFMDRCERAYKAAMHNRQQAERDYEMMFSYGKRHPTPRERELADQIAIELPGIKPGTPEHAIMRDRLTAAIRVAARSIRDDNPSRPRKLAPLAPRKIDLSEPIHDPISAEPIAS